MIDTVSSTAIIWWADLRSRTDWIFASIAFRAARLTLLASACVYGSITAYRCVAQYGSGYSGWLVAAQALNSDVYEMTSGIAGTFGLGSLSMAQRPMEFILVCIPDRLTQADAKELTAAEASFRMQLRLHAGEEYLYLKDKIARGSGHVAVHLHPWPLISVESVETVQGLRCNAGFHEHDRLSPSIFYGPGEEYQG